MESVFAKSYAKINLFLYVTDKREDGYHNIYSLFSKINLYDTIKVEKAKKFQIICNDEKIPVDRRNFIYKVYEKLREYFQKEFPVKVYLNKRIPIEAGLGGGSSNCAIFLKLMNKLFNLNLSLKDMVQVLAKVSADAPSFLWDKGVLAEGIGDKIVATIDLPKSYILLVKPNFGVSTRQAYNNKNLKLTTKPHITNIHSLSNLNVLCELMYNSLEKPVFGYYKELSFIKKMMTEYGAIKSLMSGSGSTIFGIFNSKKSLDNAYKYFKAVNKSYFVYKTNIL